MPNIATYSWTGPLNESIAQTQSLIGPGSVVLNGSLVNTSGPQPYAEFPGISSWLSITAAGSNLTGVVFTFSGTLKGYPITISQAGPTSFSTSGVLQFFDTVTSVTTNAAANDFSIGTGTVAKTHWFKHNYNSTVLGLSVKVSVSGLGIYSFITTLDDVESSSSSDFNYKEGIIIPNTGGGTAFTQVMNQQEFGSPQTAFATYIYPSRYSSVAFEFIDTDSTIDVTFLEQGIN